MASVSSANGKVREKLLSLQRNLAAQNDVVMDGRDIGTTILPGADVKIYLTASADTRAQRRYQLSLQRNLAAQNDVVMDGRDIGTTILPGADVKIYLTASADTRAQRRYQELIQKGETCDLEEIKRDIIARDERDMNREVSPLHQGTAQIPGAYTKG